MKKASSRKKGTPTRRILATKKASVSTPEKRSPLQFTQVSEEELKASRNSAYTYLVK